MASSIELSRYRITKVDYTLSGDHEGALKIEPFVQFGVPSDGSPHIRCEYTLEMSGDPPEVFSFVITAEGIFDVSEVSLMPDGTLDTAQLQPIMRIMEERLIGSVETLTKDFGIPAVHLKVVPPKS